MSAPQPHPWWPHVPAGDRRRLRRQARWLRLRAWMERRPHQIQLLVGVYLGLCAIPVLLGLVGLGGLALLPLLLVPPVGYLVYRLVWLEFHR